MIIIYCLFDKNDLPIYIGKTKNNLLIREKQHKKRLNQNVKIFELDVVKENDWKFWESYWIEQFKCWGFNLLNKNKGGGGVSNHNELSKSKMKQTPRPQTSIKLKGRKRLDVSKRLKGSKLSNITKAKISKSKINHICYKNSNRTNKIINSNLDNYKKGSNRNNKISEKLKGRKITWLKLNKSILQYDLNGNLIKEWNSMSEAANFINKNVGAISECCSGKRKTAYKYIWKYKIT